MYPLNYADLGDTLELTILTTDGQTLARQGRVGSMFVVIAFCCFTAASVMYFPKPESERELSISKRRSDLASKEDIWNPVMWKKANLIFSSMAMGIFLVLLVEFSYWGDFGTFIWEIIIIMIALGIAFDAVFEHQMQDAILMAPLQVGWAFATPRHFWFS